MKVDGTKQRILTEALRLFSREGYEAVSVEQIAAAVGIKAPSLYKHYKNKRDIFDSIVARMAELDLERAREYEMPEGTVSETAEAYREATSEHIKVYAMAQFEHWTREEFSSCFRRMLTLEQYRSAEMAELYRQYLAEGPLLYMRDIFAAIAPKGTDAMQTALDFYAPLFMLYSVYDGSDDKQRVLDIAEKHLERFAEKFSRAERGDNKKGEEYEQ